MEIQSSRITLRPSTMEDLPHMSRWMADPEVVKHTIQETKTEEEEREWLESTLENKSEILFTIIVNETGKVIGNCSLHLEQRNPLLADEEGISFGIMIGERDEWDKGYGTEATELALQYARDELKVSRVYLTVDVINVRAQRSYRKAGFCFVRKQWNPERKNSRGEQYLMEVWFKRKQATSEQCPSAHCACTLPPTCVALG